MLLTSALSRGNFTVDIRPGSGCCRPQVGGGAPHLVASVNKTWRTCGVRSILQIPADLTQAGAHAARAASEATSWHRHADTMGAEELHVLHTSPWQAYGCLMR